MVEDGSHGPSHREAADAGPKARPRQPARPFTRGSTCIPSYAARHRSAEPRVPLTRDELIAQLIQFRARYPQQGHRFVQLLDMDHDTGVTHRVSPDELLAGRQCGDYEAFCGVRFPVASMVEPGRGRCAECVTP